ncbi:ThiF family adenylyltransferase, partial [Acinetobacter baumannii]|nr:ThiF family adenylyltransferase [Acinetobacter baumannii]
LLAGRALVIGAGGLGAAALPYLASAGVGTIVVVDNDEVDLTNLQRQILHTTANVGRPKVESAREGMLRINPEIDVRLVPARVGDSEL